MAYITDLTNEQLQAMNGHVIQLQQMLQPFVQGTLDQVKDDDILTDMDAKLDELIADIGGTITIS